MGSIRLDVLRATDHRREEDHGRYYSESSAASLTGPIPKKAVIGLHSSHRTKYQDHPLNLK